MIINNIYKLAIPILLALSLCNCSNDSDNLDSPITPAPKVHFTGEPGSGNVPLTVSFIDQTINNPTSWYWDFGDGGMSTEQNPIYEYSSTGVFSVSLIAANSGGSDTLVKVDYITVTESQNELAPTADFYCDPTSGEAPLTVSFIDQTTNNPTSWSWDFGDGGMSTEQNPIYEYGNAGVYNVSLTATNSSGSDNEIKINYISISNPNTPPPEYSIVFNHWNGDLCYYPRVSSNGQYIAIEREEIVSSPGFVAHIWVYDMSLEEICQITTNPDEGYYDDRNLRFTEDNSIIYFLRTHWKPDGTYERFLCRVPRNGDEDDVEQLSDGGMFIYSFDILPDNANLLIAYYDENNDEYYTGLLNIGTNNINELNHLTGEIHNSMVTMPEGIGFIGYTGLLGDDLFSYKITKHYFNMQESEELDFQELQHIVWVLSINPDNDSLLVHQGVCTQSLTHAIPLSGGAAKQYLTEYNPPRDAVWGPDNYIYFTVDGNVMRYGPL